MQFEATLGRFWGGGVVLVLPLMMGNKEPCPEATCESSKVNPIKLCNHEISRATHIKCL